MHTLPDIAAVAKHLLGKANPALSKPGRELRFGSHGSLSVDLKKGVWHDHERGEGGGVLDLVVHEGQVATRADAATWLREQKLLDDPPPRSEPLRQREDRQNDKAERIARAQAIWSEGRDPHGTPVERYLAGRGLALPDDIRFHPKLWLAQERRFVPGMVAAFRPIVGDLDPAAAPVAVLRWFLNPDGTAIRDATGQRLKLTLAATAGAAIKLNHDEDVCEGLGLAEGVETALAVLAAGFQPVWATGGTSGMSAFPVLGGIEALTIFADNDATGAGLAAAEKCASRWRYAADVTITAPPRTGTDWNDAAADDAS